MKLLNKQLIKILYINHKNYIIMRIFIIFVLILVSCNTIKYRHNDEGKYSPAIGKSIINEQIMLGMGHRQVIASWGPPYSFSKSDGFLYLVYKVKNGRIHLYFEDNKLIGIEKR